jgi:hypothetical protein
MKKNLLVLPICAAIGLGMAIAGHSLVGNWNVAYGNGLSGRMSFKNNGTYQATFTGHEWKIGGDYKIQGNVVAFTDSVCGLHYWGKYKLDWYSDDSASVTVVEDSCAGRRSNGDGATVVRAKN